MKNFLELIKLKKIRLKQVVVIICMLFVIGAFFISREKFYVSEARDYNDMSGVTTEIPATELPVEQSFVSADNILTLSLLMSNDSGQDAVLHAQLLKEDGTSIGEYDAAIPDSEGEETVVSFAFNTSELRGVSNVILRLNTTEHLQKIYYCVQEGDYKEILTRQGEETDYRLRMRVEYRNVNRTMALLFPLLVLVLLALLLIPAKWRKTENLFVILAAAFGVFFAFINPPLQECDGVAHLYRSMDVSYGNIFSPFITVNHEEGIVYVPQNMNGSLFRQIPVNAHAGGDYVSRLKTESFSDETQMILYSGNIPSFAYYPQAVGLCLGRLFHLSIYGSILLARLFNLLAYIVMLYFAIRRMPVYKNFMAALALMPLSLYQAASCSQDSVLNGLVFLFIALCCYFAFKEEKILTWKHMLPLGFILAGLFIIKYVYVCLGLLVFLIPQKKFASKKAYWTAFAIAILPLAVLGGYHMLHTAAGVSGMQAVSEETNMTQTENLLAHPFYFVKVLKDTFLMLTTFYLQSLYILGALDCGIVVLYVIGPCYLLGVALLDAGRDCSLNQIIYSKKNRMLFGMAFFITVFFIFLGLYIADSVANPVGAGVVAGVQGRYFIPLFPLLFMTFHSNGLRCTIQEYELKICGISAIMLLCTAGVVFESYY